MSGVTSGMQKIGERDVASRAKSHTPIPNISDKIVIFPYQSRELDRFLRIPYQFELDRFSVFPYQLSIGWILADHSALIPYPVG
jgi:hypothetical protein